jgi:glycerate kinase
LGIDLEPAKQFLKGVTITALVDVNAPLLGEYGAARRYGPQKGATPAMVEELEKGMEQFEGVLSKASGMVLLKNQPGAGAAGGLGMALLALGAKLESGFEFVAQALKLEEQMTGCDLVITGEGKLDHSTRDGKAPVQVARMAKRLGIPCVAIVGAQVSDLHWLKEEGFSKVLPLFDTPFTGPDDQRKLEVPAKIADAVASLFKKK